MQHNRVSDEVLRDYKKHHPFRNLFLFCVMLMVIGVLCGASLFFHYITEAPTITRGALSSDNSTRVYDANDRIIAKLGSQNRDYIHYKQLPSNLKNGLISTEDRHFYHSDGIDPARIAEAAINDARGNNVQGGSTLTQQLVKLSVFSTSASNRTLKRKAQEAWLALKIDHNIPKNKILEYYVNKVYMGHNCYGMETASQYYYGKPLYKLDLSESALLAGMPQSPVQYDPYRFPKAAENRRDQVLNAMVANHKITQKTAMQAEEAPIKSDLATTHKDDVNYIKNEKVIDPYLKEVLMEMKKDGYQINSGIKIYTNLSMRNQQHMYDLANDKANQPGFPDNKFQIGSALVQNGSGKVNAVLGGRKLPHIPFELDRANQISRSNGSTAKSLADYPEAIQDLGYGTHTTIDDEPFYYPGTHTEVKDVDRIFKGPIGMQSAYVQSRNVPAVKTLQQVGIRRSRSMLDKMGANPGKDFTLQNAIGLYESPIQESAAYAAMLSGTGIYHKPYFINKIVRNNGTQQKFGSKGKRVMSAGTAYIMDQMMKGVIDDSLGSGHDAKIPGLSNNGGKTGTTQYADNAKYRGHLPTYAAEDSWFAGGTPRYSLCTWTGYDNPMQTGHYVSLKQINIVQRFYRYMMQYAMSQKGVKDNGWYRPKNVRFNNAKGLYLK